MKQDLITKSLRHPDALSSYSLQEWDVLIRQARNANLSARLAVLMEEQQLQERAPNAPWQHLLAARIQTDAQNLGVIREVLHVAAVLQPIGVDLVLLKGAAYLMAGLPAAKGRRFTDLDILVPKERLAEVEATLMLNGWAGSHHNRYDQRYYREWMHELPPMAHIKRMTVIDVHHAIVPATADLKPDSQDLLAHAVALPGHPHIKVLAPADMILHSATHLFYNEEFSNGLRDMSDMDLLLRHYAGDTGFWDELIKRGTQLGLLRPLYYCLRYCLYLFATPVPDTVIASVRDAAPAGRLGGLMDRLWLRVLCSQHPSAAGIRSGLARWLLYARAHWHKMPPWLLLYHLVAKPLQRKTAA